MFRIGICDDHAAVCNELEQIALKLQKNISEPMDIDVFYSGEDLLKSIREEGAYDLIFLDIELGRINGVEVGHIIRDEMEDYTTKIVYISSKNTYYKELFDVQPLHFLQKPLEEEKVIHDIKLAIKITQKENKHFSFKISKQNFKIPIRDILYFESVKREVRLVTGKASYTFYANFTEILSRLPDIFFQSHRSFIVNYEQITQFRNDELVLTSGEHIPIGRSKHKEVQLFQIEYEQKRLQQ